MSATSSPVFRSPTPSLALVTSPYPIPSESVNQWATDHLSDQHSQRIWDIWFDFSRRQNYPSEVVLLKDNFAWCKDITGRYIRDHPTATKQILLSQVAYRAMLSPPFAGPCGVSSPIVEEALQYWLALGFNLEHRDAKGNTSLLHAACTSNLKRNWGFKYFRLLIKYGADVHAVNDQGLGPLHLTLKSAFHRHRYHSKPAWGSWPNGVEEKLVALLEAGCDPNAMDHLGKTPSQYAEHNVNLLAVWTSALDKARAQALPPREFYVSSPSYTTIHHVC